MGEARLYRESPAAQQSRIVEIAAGFSEPSGLFSATASVWRLQVGRKGSPCIL